MLKKSIASEALIFIPNVISGHFHFDREILICKCPKGTNEAGLYTIEFHNECYALLMITDEAIITHYMKLYTKCLR